MDKILDFRTASLSVDFGNEVLLISWHGQVDFEEYKQVLTKATEIAEVHNIHCAIIDRLELRELNTECRVWMKNYFLKELVRPLIPNLTKVATIESRSAIGQIYAMTISKTVSLVYPNLTFRSFTTASAAYHWIDPNTAPPSLQPVAAEIQQVSQAQKSSQNNYQEAIIGSAIEQRQEHLLQSLYQLFFANR